MKLVKGILYFVVIMLAAMLVAAAFAPAKKEIIRTLEIEAPAKDVYLQVANFKK